MMENLYFFEGLDADGNPIRVENLTFKEAQELQKQEDEGKKARASDAALAPGLNADIGRYAKAKGLDKGQLGPGSDMPAASATMLSDMPATAPADADPVMGGLDKMASSREDTTQLESVLKNIPPPRATAVSEMRPGVAETTQAQPKGSIQTLLDNLPPEIAQTLLFQYRNDPKTMTPSKLLAEIRKANEEMAAIRRGQEEVAFKTDETIRGGEPDRASREKIASIEAGSREKIAGIQAATQQDKKSGYEDRTTAQLIRGLRGQFEDNKWVSVIPKIDGSYSKITDYYTQYQKAGTRREKEDQRRFLDQQLIYTFNTMLDPNSAVLPGEFERTSLGASVPTAIIAAAKSKALGGLKLDNNSRAAMYNAIATFRNQAIELARPTYEQYKNEAYADPNRPIDPYRIVGAYSKYYGDNLQPQSGGAGAPAPGETPAAQPGTGAGKAVPAASDFDALWSAGGGK